ncbi:exopolyphosphatase [Trichophaea hybrida]|nr:exopolyphosphatase [Trichophaea hybrida]
MSRSVQTQDTYHLVSAFTKLFPQILNDSHRHHQRFTMPPGHNFLRTFLHLSRTALISASKSSTPISVVLGNESADLDSFASSFLYAYLSSVRPRPIPFLAIPRADLSLRPEFLFILSKLQLSPSDLLCADDSPSFSTLNPENVNVHLVDHNRLTVPLLGENVHGIIDHHDDEGFYMSASPRVITQSGSCSSLVINHLLNYTTLEEGERSQLATLALAAVLIDTANMTHKVTAHDQTALKLLRDNCLPASWDQEAFFQGVYDAKTNVDGLSLRDLLRKDYKEWTEDGKKLGISSVVKGLEYLRGRGAFLETLKEWARERRLDVVCVMTTDGRGEEYRRELLVWAVKKQGAECLRLLMETAEERGLKLGVWGNGELDDGVKRRAWTQGNLSMSRKQVAPLLRECLKSGNDTTAESKV